ncbi:recombination regulator RecX [Desertibacillus haloalkaliphilus]|uniref:recombination regulator RecX n=1 Tax=Desertibacillus haloalkaliphilus TaxID=1328930 RepID=UPI001C27CC93|nr:recombination regulator RecX [Desertibacillus haloalkaliphilus]MBU8908875.1 recombination regulator RecX [Desertibacillus haloalkaliphilus]
MVVITKITTQKKNTERFNIFIDRGSGEEFGFSVDQDVLIKHHLKKGVKLSEEQLRDIFYDDGVKKAFNLAINYLSYRMRTKKEISQYLAGKEIEPAVIDEVIVKLNDYRYIDDLAFANAFVRSRMNTTAKGPRVIRQELIEKGITNKDIEKSLTQYPLGQQIETAVRLLEKKSNQYARLSEKALKAKLSEVLASKGFSMEVIHQAIAQVEIEKDEGEEWEALLIQANKVKKRYAKYDGYEYKQRMKQFLYRKGFPLDLIDRYLKCED